MRSLRTLRHRIERLEQQQSQSEASQPRTLFEEVAAAYRRLIQRQRHADDRRSAADGHQSDYMILLKALENQEFRDAMEKAAQIIQEEEERENPPAAPSATREQRSVQETHITGDASRLRPVFRLRNPPESRE